MSINTKVPHLSSRKTKIIATLGPASDNFETILQLIKSGVNVFRLNMSHGDHNSHELNYQNVRNAASELNEPITIFADLCGPKIRTGKFKNGSIELINDDQVTVTTREIIGENRLIPSQYQALADDVKVGDHILLDDGKLELKVETVNAPDISCRVIHGGELKNNKGINLPGVNVSCPSMTEKDYQDAIFAMELGVDYLALSFVRTAQDIVGLRQLIQQHGHDIHIIAKIEKPEALQNAREIIEASDAIMVARGDLGVEIAAEEVPIAQNQLIQRARALNKPVIIATQMLESMITTARPTRAEVTDVSHAVYGGADAVMLSGETAAGKFPIQTVEMMSRIIKQTEAYMFEQHSFGQLTHQQDSVRPLPLGDAVADATAQVCADLQAKLIIGITGTGWTVVTLSSARPSAPLIGVSNKHSNCRRMNLYWGVIPVFSAEATHTHPNPLAREIAQKTGLVEKNEHIIIVRGFHKKAELNTPTITMMKI